MKKIEIQKTYKVRYKVQYEVEKGLLKVVVEGIGEKSTQLGNLPEESLAKQLAEEIIKENEKK